MLDIHKAQMQKKFDKLHKKSKFLNKYLVIFGAGYLSKDIFDCVTQLGLQIDAIIDNDTKKIGRYCVGLPIIHPSCLPPERKNDTIIFIYSGFYKDMIRQLVQLGYPPNKNIINLAHNDVFDDDSLRCTIKNIFRLTEGQKTRKKLLKQYPYTERIFICPYTGTGDIYLAGLFFQRYIIKHSIDNYIFVVVSGACKKVAQLFDIENIVVISTLKAEHMLNSNIFADIFDSEDIMNDCWATVYMSPVQWIRGYKGHNFTEMFRRFVFQLPDNDMQFPTLKSNRSELESLFRKKGLKIGKTCVLSPYSNTLFKVLPTTWNVIVKELKKRGYTVCTNSCGDSEPAIEGTVPVFFPLTSASEFMDMAGIFIGVRSGLCDIICKSTCKKFILYEKGGFFYQSSTFEYFNLRNMGLCDDATELKYSIANEKFCIEQIINNL